MDTVHHRLDTAEIAAMFANPAGGLARDMYRRGKRVEGGAKRLVQVDTGRTRASITTAVQIRGRVPVARVGTDVRIAMWLHNGTGLYGPRRRMIKPVRARQLAWQARGTNTWVYARKVKGMKGSRFLKRALPLARG